MTTSGGETRRWFYVREGRRHGPVETTRLVDLVLGGEVPEDSLVWHSGLPEWLSAREVEEIRRELPPPVPTTPVPPPPEPVPRETSEAAEPPAPSEEAKGGVQETPPESPDLEGLSNGQKRRRKRKHRHRDSKKRPPWLWPLAVVLVVLMIFLWWLLRRMNEVPPGRIIQTGSARVSPSTGGAGLHGPAASASRWASSPGSARASSSARPA